MVEDHIESSTVILKFNENHPHLLVKASYLLFLYVSARRGWTGKPIKKPAHGAPEALRNYGKPKFPGFLMVRQDCKRGLINTTEGQHEHETHKDERTVPGLGVGRYAFAAGAGAARWVGRYRPVSYNHDAPCVPGCCALQVFCGPKCTQKVVFI